MKIIIIPETDNRGTGKIKFILDGDKIFFEILDKEKFIVEYSLEFRIHECSLIKKEIRDAQQSLIYKLCRLHLEDKENAFIHLKENVFTQEEVFENFYRFQMVISGGVHCDANLLSEEKHGEIKEKISLRCFKALKEAFENELLISKD